MNYKKTVEYIHSLGFFSSVATTQRIKEVMGLLGNPQDKLRCIHIAGTNGKGSVSAMIATALKEQGLRVGIFISPFIVDFRERIQINGEYIREDDLCRISQKVIDTKIKLTEFEFITAIGFLYFYEKGVDVAVVEVGLGGRLDATNIIKNPLACAITKIGLDHTAVLGDSISQIAAEKCGIIKNACVITSPNQEGEALSVIKKYAPEVIIPDTQSLEILSTDVSGNSFVYKGTEYKTILGGDFQIENALIAIETLNNCGIKVGSENIKKGLSAAFMPARAEIVSQNPLTVLDGAHNPDGAAALRAVMQNYKNITAVVGVMRDKNFEAVLSTLLPLCENVFCVKVPQNERSLGCGELKKCAEKYCKNVFCCEDVSCALDAARKTAGDNPVFVFGSLYLASAAREKFKNF